ncbi:MAG: MmgE/PrpD family protein [Alphaproteobacteria bacterium]
MTSLTRDLVRHIQSKDISPDDLSAAALFTVDAVANALAGRTTEPGRILLDWADRFGGDDAGRQALLQGGLTHILEMDDLHRASVVHPGCVVVPAAFAVCGDANGAALLGAVLKGFEATCRVGMAVGAAHYRIWHNTATCGPYGSAMAAADLLGLDEEASVQALGNAGTQSAGLWEFLDTGAMSKHLHAGRAAEAGVVAAQLATLGFTGPPAILEGPRGFFAAACPDADPTALLANPGARWQLHETSIKPWPSCRHTHPAVDAALELSGGLNVDDIESVTVGTYQTALDVCDRAGPGSVYEAKFSLQHCVAAALSDGKLDFDSFEDAGRDAVAPLRARVELFSEDIYNDAYPEDWGATVDVALKNGQRKQARRAMAKGDPQTALGDDEMRAKAMMLMAFGGLGGNDAGRLIDGILEMANGGAVPELPIPR